MPSHYLNQCSIVVNWTLKNKLHSNCIRNPNIFIHANETILSRGRWVNCLQHGYLSLVCCQISTGPNITIWFSFTRQQDKWIPPWTYFTKRDKLKLWHGSVITKWVPVGYQRPSKIRGATGFNRIPFWKLSSNKWKLFKIININKTWHKVFLLESCETADGIARLGAWTVAVQQDYILSW